MNNTAHKVESVITLRSRFFSENKMLAALLSIEPEKVYAMPDPTLPDDDYKLMATLSDLADRELVATIGWAKQVPGRRYVLATLYKMLRYFIIAKSCRLLLSVSLCHQYAVYTHA